MSRSMQAAQPTALVPRGWPSMAAASARICRSSHAFAPAGRDTPAVLSLVAPVSLESDAYAVSPTEELAIEARLEGQIVVTLASKDGKGEPAMFTIPLKATIAGAPRLVAAGAAEE